MIIHEIIDVITIIIEAFWNQFYIQNHPDKAEKNLAQHYGFTDEELDFIINCDIKYRMGQSGGE